MKPTLYSALLVLIIILNTAFKPKQFLKTESITKIENSIQRDSLIAYAKTFLGTPYVYAGNSPEKGFDCSGYLNYVYSHFGISLPRTSSAFKNLGEPLAPKEFKVGDVLVFYGYKDHTRIGHLGIICKADGMQSEFIHASSGKANGVTISSLASEHYTKRFYKCISVLEE